jgi:putative copper export protein
LIRTLLIVSALASCAEILATAASMSGDMAGLFDLGLTRMILQAGEGRATLLRLIGLSLMVPAPAVRRPPPWALIGALVAATSFAWMGHVHALAEPWLAASVLVLHLLGAAFWLGALMPLLMVSRGADVSRVAATAARFGASALVVVAELWTSGYGRLVLSKIVLVACLLALAALNHFRLTPGLIEGDGRALRALQKSIRFEIALAGAILIVTAAMTTVAGPAAFD